MSYRFMRVLVFFDLPTVTRMDRKNYGKFRRFLVKDGFLMLQESVYAKLALNSSQVAQIISTINRERPEKGLVQILSITEKQFSKMEIFTGRMDSDVVDTDERLLIL